MSVQASSYVQLIRGTVYRALKNPPHPNATTESCQNHREPTISQQQQL